MRIWPRLMKPFTTVLATLFLHFAEVKADEVMLAVQPLVAKPEFTLLEMRARLIGAKNTKAVLVKAWNENIIMHIEDLGDVTVRARLPGFSALRVYYSNGTTVFHRVRIFPEPCIGCQQAR